MEHLQFLEKHQAICQDLGEKWEKIFEMANGICRQLTNLDGEVGSIESSVNAYIYERFCMKLMHSLTQLKVYEPVEDDEYDSNGGGKRLQLVNQSRFISDWWEVFFTKFSNMSDDYTRQVLYIIGDLNSKNNLRVLMRKWRLIASTFDKGVHLVTGAFGYIYENLPQLGRNIRKDCDLTDLGILQLIDSFKAQMGSKFVVLIEMFLENDISEKNPENWVCDNLPHKLFHYQIIVDEERNLTFQDLYFEYLAKHIKNNVVLPVNMDFTKNLKTELEYNAKITLLISPTLIEESNDIFLQHTILKPEVASQLIEMEKDNVQFYSVRMPGSSFPFPKENFFLLKVAFESRGRVLELEMIYKRLLRKLMKRVHSDLEKLFSEACKSILLVYGHPNFVAISREEVIKTLGGSLNIMELYVRFCESSIRKANRDGNLGDHFARSRSIFHAPTLLEMNPAVLDLYSRSLFRRAIMQGANSVLKSLKSPESLEYQLIAFFREVYGTSSEFRNLEATTEIIFKASNLESSFERSSSDKHKFIQPLIFEKKIVPTIYQQDSNEDVVLPRELIDSWGEFIRHFNLEDKKPELKKVHPVYHLQHCEVSTPYKLKSGKRLCLELTLYQTCLLSLFNDFDELEFNDIMTKLRMTESTLIVVLKSFVDSGLLILQDNNKYTLNRNYSPDKKKIKDGKLRIPLSRPAVSSNPSSFGGNILASSQHNEGHSSQWKQELLKACVVRSLKGENSGLNLIELFNKVESQIRGVSIGEFKDALNAILKDRFIRYRNERYLY